VNLGKTENRCTTHRAGNRPDRLAAGALRTRGGGRGNVAQPRGPTVRAVLRVEVSGARMPEARLPGGGPRVGPTGAGASRAAARAGTTVARLSPGATGDHEVVAHVQGPLPRAVAAAGIVDQGQRVPRMEQPAVRSRPGDLRAAAVGPVVDPSGDRTRGSPCGGMLGRGRPDRRLDAAGRELWEDSSIPSRPTARHRRTWA
jgi:hypothetical protein